MGWFEKLSIKKDDTPGEAIAKSVTAVLGGGVGEVLDWMDRLGGGGSASPSSSTRSSSDDDSSGGGLFCNVPSHRD